MNNTIANILVAETPLGSWKIRRALLFAITFFCMAVIVLIIYLGREGRIYETISDAAFYTLGIIFSVYVVGATWDDRNKYNAVVKNEIVDKATPDALADSAKKLV